MNQSKPKNLIYRKLFLISVVLLLLNDFYLKYHFHNYLTGKLSDFVGLFAFPYFVSLLFKSKIKPIYILTGVLFLFWKSNLSQFIFDYFNGIGIGINRVVDYSDFMALLVLPLSYRYRKQNSIGIEKIKLLPKPLIITVCSFAFIATTLAGEIVELNLKSNYEYPMRIQKDSLDLKMFKTAIFQWSDTDKYRTNLMLPDKNASIQISLFLDEIGKDSVNVKLDSIKFSFVHSSGFFSGVKKKNLDYIKSLKLEDFEQLFIEQKINELNKY